MALPVYSRWAILFLEFLTLILLDSFTSSVLPAFAPLVGLQGLYSPPVTCVPVLNLPTPPETLLPPGSPLHPHAGLSILLCPLPVPRAVPQAQVFSWAPSP